MGNFVTGSRIIGAAPERVWDLLVRVDRWPSTFTPHLREAHLDGDLAVGATGWVRTRLPRPRSPFVVTALEPGRSWAWRGDLLWLTLDFNHRVEAEGIVGTRVTFDLDLNGRGAVLVRLVGRLLYGRQMQRALDLLVEQAEGRG